MSSPGELIHAYLDGTLDEAGLAELERVLQSDPTARRQLADMCAMHALLAESVRGGQELSKQSARSHTLANRMRALRPRQRRNTGALGWLLASAACAALVLGIYIAQTRPPKSGALATIESANGAVSLERTGATHTITTRRELLDSDTLTCGADGTVDIIYADGTRLSLLQDSATRFESDAGAKRLTLQKGGLIASVAKQPSGQAMIFTTPHAHATVLGTRLTLNAQTDGTRLGVEEGRVRLSLPNGANALEVASGRTAFASASGAVAFVEPKPETPPPFGPTTGRPFTAESPWNSPIPANPALDPNSAAIAKNIGRRVSLSMYRFAVPIYDAYETSPIRKVATTMPWGPNPFNGFDVRIPDGAKPNSGNNAAFVVIDWHARRTWEFYKFTWNGTDVTTAWGGTTSIDGNGTDIIGAGTAGASQLAGLIRVREIEAGCIDHAITIATQFAAKVVRFPGRKSDGDYSGPGALPVGARVQLDPALDLATIPDLSRAELAIGRALQIYGAYCVGKTGAPFLINFELAPDATSQTNPGNVYEANGFPNGPEDLKRIPWDRLRVLKTWNGKDSN